VQSNATTGAASLWSFSVAKYGAQQSVDPYQTDAGNGVLSNGTNVVNDPTDAYVSNSVAIEQALVQHLVSKWGLSTTTNGVKYYVLDNEPSLWNSTHRDVHPSPETYEEEYNNIVNYATAIRAVDPNAKIVGPEEWIWWAMWVSGLDQANGTGAGSDYASHSNTYYYPWLLQQLYAHQQSSGIKMLDVLSVHCYTDGSYSQYNYLTRELWDPNYQDPNWEGANGVDLNGGVLDWIPLMKQWVNQYYPGLQVGCTEYDWGNSDSLSGATSQADVLGIFGLYGLDLATNWGVPPTPGYLAMQIYRNYDGNLSTFGDTSVSSTVADPDNLSAFAAVRSSDKALTIMVINKQTGTTPVTLSLANFANTGTATAYQISSASQTSINALGSVTVASNAINFTAPSQSVTLFVVPASTQPTEPVVSLSPTSLSFGSETVGADSASQTVTLTNSGDATLTFTSIAVTGANASSFVFANTCGSSLAAGDSCSIHGYFTPTTTGSLSASINIVDNASNSPQAVALSGTGVTSKAATMTSPTPGSTLSGTSATFTWTAGTGVTQYDLHVGTTGAGSSNIFGGTVAGQSKSVTGIPTTGATLNVRLYSLISGAWQYNDYVYTEANPATKAAMSTPAPGSTLTGSSATFTWTAGTGVTQYTIHVGSTGVGSDNISAPGALTGTSYTVSNIPTTGGTLYVRLYSLIAGAWQYTDYTYTEANPATKAAMSTPAPGSTLTGSSATFTWTAGTGVTQYTLHVGTTGVGSDNISAPGALTGTNYTVTGIPTTGGMLYVRLYSLISGAWQYTDYTYTEQ